MRLRGGNVDFNTQAHREKALIKGLKKREGVIRKQLFNADLKRRMRKELVDKSAHRSNGAGPMYFELFTARILGFFCLLRISEIEAHRWDDISVDMKNGESYLSIRIRKSKTDIFKDGILRPLIDIDSVLRPSKTFQEWKRMEFMSGGEQSIVFWPRLRERVSAITKTDAMANGVYGKRIDTHSLRSGGATALYSQGVPLGVIQRWGRWKSLTFHQYLWRDAAALDALSEVIVKSRGSIHCLKLMNKEPKSASFQQNSETMVDAKEDVPKADRSVATALFLPNDRFAACSAISDPCAGLDSSVFSASDFTAYTASPSDHVTTFHGSRPLKNQEKIEKREKDERERERSDEAGHVTKVELFPGEEGVSSKSSPSAKSVVSMEICPYGNESTESDSERKVPEIYHMGSLCRSSPLGRTTRRRRNIRSPREPHRRRPEQSGCRMASRGRRSRSHFAKHRGRSRK